MAFISTINIDNETSFIFFIVFSGYVSIQTKLQLQLLICGCLQRLRQNAQDETLCVSYSTVDPDFIN